MFAPTKIWRKWHRKVNTTQRRLAVSSALAASALPSLVLARGHSIARVPEIPLVVEDAVQGVTKTSAAVALLTKLHAHKDVDRVKRTRKLRPGKGKLRNRRHVSRLGPLVVYAEDNGVTRAFRNLPGVELAHVSRLNLLRLAPGGHLGRFIIWTKSAFLKLDEIFGTYQKAAVQKVGYHLPRSVLSNADIQRIINSDDVQKALRPKAQPSALPYRHKKNPLRNLREMIRLNPYQKSITRRALLVQAERAAGKAEFVAKKRAAVPEAKRKEAKAAHKLSKKHGRELVQ
jgi:large subunit ribosomal protein L4e